MVQRRFRGLFIAAFMLLFVLVKAGDAQLSTASVSGVVRDASGAVVANATVTLRNVATSIQTVTISNGTGSYAIVSITPGEYTIEATAQGFSTEQMSRFNLTVGQEAAIDFALSPGAVTTKVTVEGGAPILETTTANLGTVIGTQQVNDLPLNGRNFTQLLQLTAGVAPVNNGQSSGGGFAGPPIAKGTTAEFPAVNGQGNRSNFFLTDGLNNYWSILSTYAVPPIIDAIQEFKIVSHTDSPEYGGVLGGVVNVVTKTGTNQLHGSAWEFARNAIFDAIPTFTAPGTPQPDFSQNQFGGSIGGPVILPKLYHGRDKTFFFASYQGFRFTQTSNTPLFVPTVAELGGDLSALGVPIYNPFTTRPDPNHPGQFIRDIFPGAIIPKNLIDPQVVALAQFLYPAAGPAFNNGASNANDPTPLTQTQNEFTVRVDHTFGPKDSVWFRYSFINNLQTSSGGLPGLPSTLTTPARNWGGSYVHTFSPTLILQAQASKTTGEHNLTTLFAKSTSSIISQVGFAQSYVAGYQATAASLIPQVQINGFSGGGERLENIPKATDSSEFRATVTKIVGSHEIKFGAGYTTLGFESPIAGSSVQFAANETASSPTDATTGLGLASFLLNVPDNAQRRNVRESERPGGVFGSFVQDSWKTTKKLTLNFGLRYDITFIPPYGANGSETQQGGIATGDVNFNNGTYVLQVLPQACSVVGHAPCIPGNGQLPAHVVVDPRGKIPHNTYTNVGPRLGIAYRLDDKTVVRSGFGVFFDNFAAITQIGQNIQGQWPDTGELIANGLNNPNTSPSPTPTVTIQNPFAGGLGSNIPAPTPFTQVGFFYDPNIKNAYSEQYNLGVARQFGQTTTVTINYVGSESHRLDVGGYYNTARTPGPGNPALRSPFPYITPTYYDRSTGNGTYNSLQVSIDRRFTSNFSYSVAYTWAKSIDEGGDGFFGVEGGVPQDPYHPASFGSRSVSGNDLTNVLSVSTLYAVPLGKGKGHTTGNRALDYLLGNWQLNNIFLARSGLPFTVTVDGDIANTGNVGGLGNETANLIGNPNAIARRSAAEYFNTAAYAAPPQFTYGTSGRNSLRTAGYWDLDTSLFRQFPFGESYRVEIRAEAFNLFNHPVLGFPNADFSNRQNFGTVTTTASTPRQVQLAVRFVF
jgi:Carboxypeptidase regulatory-like domain